MWGLTVVGIAIKIFFTGRFALLSTIVYLLMGWLAVVAIKPLMGQIPLAGFLWLLAGGLIYSSGVIFYVFRRIPYGHAIWHLFVLAASVCQYFAILFYVLPTKAS